MKTFIAVVTALIIAPIWYYLLFKILKAVEATELMWFLFWVYLPVSMLLSILRNIMEKQADTK